MAQNAPEAVKRYVRHGASPRGALAIALGLKADIVVFDPETIAAMSTWDDPGKMSIGVKHVLVNGELVLHKERLTGNTPGKQAVPSRRK